MSETPRRPRYDVVTLHPEMVEGPLHGSILGRGQQVGAIDVRIFNIRDHGIGKHRSVDDTPYGGGAVIPRGRRSARRGRGSRARIGASPSAPGGRRSRASRINSL